MINFIKYDLKSSRRYIRAVLIIEMLFILGAFGLNRFFGINKMLSNNSIANLLLLAFTIVFIFVNLYYVFLSLYKDFFTKRAILTFTLPLSSKSFLLGKLFGIAIFYMLSAALLLVFFKLLDYLITIELLYYFGLGLILIIMFSLILSIAMEEHRFNNNKYAWLLAILFIVVIFVIGFLLSRFLPITFVGNEIKILSPIDHAFIFPLLREGDIVYKIVTPFIYYIVISVILFFISSNSLSKDVDLS